MYKNPWYPYNHNDYLTYFILRKLWLKIIWTKTDFAYKDINKDIWGP